MELFFANLFAYVVFILILIAPLLVAVSILGLLLFGVGRILAGIRLERRVDVLGTAIIVSGLAAGTIFYQWSRGPAAELAKLEPLVVDSQLASSLPDTWVLEYGASFAALDLLPNKYARRVFNARVTDSDLLASIPRDDHAAFMEEVKLVVSPSCNALIASKNRDASRALACVTRNPMRDTDILASGPYLKLTSEDTKDMQVQNFVLVTESGTRPIARCVGRAPREANPLLALIRGNRSNEVASSMFKCRMRAATGALERVIATGAVA